MGFMGKPDVVKDEDDKRESTSMKAEPDQDEEMPDISKLLSGPKGKLGSESKGKAKATFKVKKAPKRRNKRRVVDSDSDNDEDVDSDDDLSDFIVRSDEDEEMKDERKKTKKRLSKRRSTSHDSDFSDSEAEEVFDDVIIGAKGPREPIRMNEIQTLPKSLPSTKMMVKWYLHDLSVI